MPVYVVSRPHCGHQRFQLKTSDFSFNAVLSIGVFIAHGGAAVADGAMDVYNGEYASGALKIAGGALEIYGSKAPSKTNSLSEVPAITPGKSVGKTADDVGKVSSEVDLPISQTKVNEILSIEKGKRPDPSEYLSQAEIKAHLEKFDEGAIRFTSKPTVMNRGTLGGEEAFVMPRKEFENLIRETGGDLRKVEEKLGFDRGYLNATDTGVYYIPPSELKGIKMPSGNEAGVNSKWVPGGKTSGGVSEGVIYLKNPKIKYEEVNIKGLLND